MNRPVVNFDGPLHQNYRAARELRQSSMLIWRTKIRHYLADRTGLNVLDLGSGTGRFSVTLAEALDADVVGVEPADAMRSVALREVQHPRVRFLAGTADQIPLDSASCDAAWLSQMLHHVPDIPAAAAEVQRVMRSGGRVLIRNGFQGRLKDHCRYYQFFPTGLAVDDSRHPTIEQTTRAFEACGFRLVANDVIEQLEAPSLSAYADRIRQRAFSTFELITDSEFAAGLADLQAAADREQPPQPVMGKLDLLVFERT